MKKHTLGLAFFLLGISSAWATTDENRAPRPLDLESLMKVSPNASLAISPEQIFLKTQDVLNHYGVPAEPESQPAFADLQSRASEARLKGVLRFLDFKKRYLDYVQVVTTADGGRELQGFQDLVSRKVPDFQIRLTQESSLPVVADSFRDRLLRAAQNPATRPLEGLKIALDPGHMGGDLWDERTGKFVKDKVGNKLSEGVMVLQASLLLEKELQDLGAEVFVTHRGIGPVSDLDYDTFDLRPFAVRSIRANSLEDWFQNLLAQNASGSDLYQAFSLSPDFKKLFSESRRWTYFVLGADLDARAKVIQEFSPDITLIIHMDTNEPPGDPTGINPKGYQGTKAYVAGGFYEDEFATRVDRMYFTRHLLDADAWDASVQLSRSVVGQIRSQLGIRFDPSDGGNSIPVEPGILARNLNLQRKLPGHATSYVECLFYNDPKEFAALLDARHPMVIDGKNYPYSDRLVELVRALRDGVVGFVRSYQ